jgi:ABC-2 type transport system ATP-binding protein
MTAPPASQIPPNIATSTLCVSFRDVRKSFGKAEILRGVSFGIAPGEFVGLAGVNGAGKTTLLKCMLDFSAPSAGEIELFGVPSKQPEARARLAFLPERFTPPYYLDGEDFLRFSAQMMGIHYPRARLEEVVDALDLDRQALRRSVRSYSKGMMQKLGLAAAFLAERELLVLDEPMSGLDPKARACVKKLFTGLRKAGRSLFFTSHSLADIDEVCDRLIVIHQGVPYFAGTPQRLCQDFGGSSGTTTEQAFLRCIETQPHDRFQ